MLVIQISSRSTMVMFPIPDLASASTDQEPTPPMPMTATWALENVCNAFDP